MEYLESNNVKVNNQFGFRKGRSCVTNLICFYSRVTDIIQEREGWADCIYLDLTRSRRRALNLNIPPKRDIEGVKA